MALYSAPQYLYDWYAGPGVAVEVGAHDGAGWTQGLEDVGWTVICLEPHPRYFLELRKNRPKAILCNAAASDRDGHAKMLVTKEGICSSLEPGIEDVISEVYHSYTVEGYENVPCTTLNSLFDLLGHFVKPGIDVVIIDTEGHDLSVLRGFNLKRWMPRLVMIEQLPYNQVTGLKKVESVDKIMVNAGYMLVGHANADSYYAWQPEDIRYWEKKLNGRERWWGDEEDGRLKEARKRLCAEPGGVQ